MRYILLDDWVLGEWPGKQNGEELTVVFARKEVFIVISVPRENFNEIGYERWDLTFEHDTVPSNDILLIDVGVVMLGNHLYMDKELILSLYIIDCSYTTALVPIIHNI